MSAFFFIFSYLTALTYYRKEKENTTITKKHMHDLLMYGLIPRVSSLMRPRELGCLSEVAQGNEVRRDAVVLSPLWISVYYVMPPQELYCISSARPSVLPMVDPEIMKWGDVGKRGVRTHIFICNSPIHVRTAI